MDALILAGGDLAPREVIDATWPGWDDDVRLVLAADGGARHARALAVRIDRWIGDGDSVDPADLEALVAAGVPIERTRPDKDESDTELAVRAGSARSRRDRHRRRAGWPTRRPRAHERRAARHARSWPAIAPRSWMAVPGSGRSGRPMPAAKPSGASCPAASVTSCRCCPSATVSKA